MRLCQGSGGAAATARRRRPRGKPWLRMAECASGPVEHIFGRFGPAEHVCWRLEEQVLPGSGGSGCGLPDLEAALNLPARGFTRGRAAEPGVGGIPGGWEALAGGVGSYAR